MGQRDELSHAAPPRFLEFLVRRMVPGAYREQVLGDLHERYKSPFTYIMDASSAVPAAIVNQMRRTTTLPFLLLEGLSVYVSFLAAAVCMHWVEGPWNFLQVARLTAIIMAGLLLYDIYSTPPLPPRWWKLIEPGIYLIVYFSCGVSWGWQIFHGKDSLFLPIMTTQVGLFICVILLSLLRKWIEAAPKYRRHGRR